MANVGMVVTNPCFPDPRVERHARWLVEMGHEVRILAWDRFEEFPKVQQKDGYTIIRTGPYLSQKSKNFEILRKKKKFLKNINENFDLLILNDTDTYGIKTDSKTILDIHDLAHGWPLMAGNSIFHKLISKLMYYQAKRMMKNADLILTSSPGLLKWVQKHGHKADVIMNYRNESEKVTRTANTIGYFGRIRNFESMEKLLTAAKKIDFDVILAGDGPQTEMVIARYPDLDYRGPFTEDQLSDLMKEISVMYALYPPNRLNIVEGAISVKMLDAASHGIPSVVSKGNPMANFCEEHKLGLSADYFDIENISQTILETSKLEVSYPFKEDKTAFTTAIQKLDF